MQSGTPIFGHAFPPIAKWVVAASCLFFDEKKQNIFATSFFSPIIPTF
jgi:hypothetical protein